MQTTKRRGHSVGPFSPFFHTRSSTVMRVSVACRIRIDRKNKTESAPVYLQVIINGERTTIPMKISWPTKFFDNKKGLFLARYPGDRLATDYNLEVTKEIGKINDIFIFYRHSDGLLTVDQFHKETKRWGARNNFIEWAKMELQERFDEHKIALQTWKNDLSAIKKVEKFRATISFAELDLNFLESLNAWLYNVEKLRNATVARILTTVTTYTRRAERAGLSVNILEINQFKIPKYSGRLIYLKPIEITKLKDYFFSTDISDTQKNVLSHFLFSCLSGLRISDIQRVSWKNIHDDILVLQPYKTRRSEIEVRIPLIDEHFEYIHNEKGLLFNCMTEQAMNRTLKEIAKACHIRKNLTTHVARHTFATEFLRRGGHIEVLQKLMGHAKISTTLIYTHVDDDRLKDQMGLFISQDTSNQSA